MTVESKKELRSIFNLKKIFFVLLGNTIYCAGIVAFVLPTALVTGGTTGLGLIVNHYFGVPIELFAAIFNTVMFLLAIVLLGKVVCPDFADQYVLFSGYSRRISKNRMDAGTDGRSDALYGFRGSVDRRGDRYGHQSGGIDGRYGYSAVDPE